MEKESNLKIKDESIRRHFDEKSKRWYFSVVDVIAIITKSSDPRNYWKVLKNRFKKKQNDLVSSCSQIKMMASDGKFYMTDTADEETIIKIIKLISPQHYLSFRLWFDNLASPIGFGPKDKEKSSLAKKDVITMEGEETGDYFQEELMLLIDGYFENNIITIKTFVPMEDIKNLSVSVTSKEMTIRGEHEKQKNISEENYDIQELCWGKFSRSITLPYQVEVDQAETYEHHGLLTIKLPVINKDKARVLTVKNIKS